MYLPQGSSLFEYMPSHISDRGNTVFRQAYREYILNMIIPYLYRACNRRTEMQKDFCFVRAIQAVSHLKKP